MEFKIKKSESGLSVNDFLRKTHNFSRRIVSRAKFENAISVNGKSVFTSYILNENDILNIDFSEKQSPFVVPQGEIPLEILFEDEHVLAINKPPHMPPHPSKGHPDKTLANAVAGYYKSCNINTAVRILGRLDKNTSGVVIICKNEYSAKLMGETDISKEYFAICHGKFDKKSGLFDFPIMREAEGSVRRICHKDGKPAATRFQVVLEKNKFSLLQLRLITGRTHQIRVHLSHSGHPIVGDSLYGGEEILPRQALHARKISFLHPVFGKKIEIVAPVPKDMADFLVKEFSFQQINDLQSL